MSRRKIRKARVRIWTVQASDGRWLALDGPMGQPMRDGYTYMANPLDVACSWTDEEDRAAVFFDVETATEAAGRLPEPSTVHAWTAVRQ